MPANASQGQLSDKVSGKIPAQIIGKKSYLQLEKIEATYPSAPALLLIHGWGASSSVWQPCSELLRQHFDLYFFDLPGHGRNAGCAFASPDELLDAFSVTLLPRLPAKFSVLGWSLGGLIASLLAARFGDRVSALITTATNVSFVASEQWPKGIAHDVFERFAAGISIDSDAAQRADILRRFHGLQFHGSAAARRQLRAYQQCLAATHYSSHGLWQGLQWLQEGDLQSCWRQLSLPVLHQYGVEDPLLPGTVAAAIKKEFPDHCVACFDHSGHLPFFDQPSRWVECCVDFYLVSCLQPIETSRPLRRLFHELHWATMISPASSATPAASCSICCRSAMLGSCWIWVRALVIFPRRCAAAIRRPC